MLSRSNKAVSPPPAQTPASGDLFGLGDDDSTPVPAEQPLSTSEPKKPASTIDSMMEQTLSKVTYKPPPMIAKVAPSPSATQQQAQPQQSGKPQQQPQSQPQAAKSKFDWSSQNYRDIFASVEQEVQAPAAQV